MQGQAEKLRLASAVVDANISAHPGVHPPNPGTVAPAAHAPTQPPSCRARSHAPAPERTTDAAAAGGVGGTSEDAGADHVVRSRSVAIHLHDVAASARHFVSTLPAGHVSMGDLPTTEAATARHLAGSCATSCMQFWAASIHYDVAPQIAATLAQHTQYGKQPADDVNAPASELTTRSSHERACKAAPKPTQKQVAHNSASESGPLLLPPAGCSADSAGASTADKLSQESEALEEYVEGLIHGPSPMQGVVEPKRRVVRPLGDMERLTTDAWPSSVPSLLDLTPAPGAGGPPQPPAGDAPECSVAPVATSAALERQPQGDECGLAAAADASLRRGHDQQQLLALAQR